MHFSLLPLDVVETILDHLAHLDNADRLQNGFRLARVCKGLQAYGYNLALRQIVLPNKGGRLLDYLLAHPPRMAYVRSITVKPPVGQRRRAGVHEEPSKAIRKLLRMCPRLLSVSLPRLAGGSPALSSLVTGNSAALTKSISLTMPPVDVPNSIAANFALLAQLPSLRVLGLKFTPCVNFTRQRRDTMEWTPHKRLRVRELKVTLLSANEEAFFAAAIVMEEVQCKFVRTLQLRSIGWGPEVHFFEACAHVESISLHGDLFACFYGLRWFRQLTALQTLTIDAREVMEMSFAIGDEPVLPWLLRQLLPATFGRGRLRLCLFDLSDLTSFGQVPCTAALCDATTLDVTLGNVDGKTYNVSLAKIKKATGFEWVQIVPEPSP